MMQNRNERRLDRFYSFFSLPLTVHFYFPAGMSRDTELPYLVMKLAICSVSTFPVEMFIHRLLFLLPVVHYVCGLQQRRVCAG